MDDYDLSTWKTSALLKEAIEHLRDQPEYVVMSNDARAELTRFGHALRRELRKAKDRVDAGDTQAMQTFCNEYGMSVASTDNCRFGVTVFEYRMAIILDINLSGNVVWAEQILFDPEY